MSSIRWGIIGCGDVTERKSGPGFQIAQNSQLIAVMRRNGELARDYAQRHGVSKWYDDADALIHDEEVDAVYVATPPDSHFGYVRMVADAGKPVYVEKPMARDYSESCEMVRYCEQKAVPLFVAHYRRGLDYFNKAKTLLSEGAIGDVRAAEIRMCQPTAPPEGELPWRLDPAVSGGGLFHDLAPHTLDILDYMLGPIQEAAGFTANQQKLSPADDTVAASFVFENGALGTGLWSFAQSEPCDTIVIDGTQGRISLSTFAFTPIALKNGNGEEVFDFPAPHHIQTQLIQSIVDDLNGQGVCPSRAREALRTMRVMDEILGKL